MSKFFIKSGMRGLFSFDPETENINMSDYIHTAIDWVYEVPEDGELVINNGETKKVKKGDIVIQFYKSDYRPYDVIVVKSKEWKANIAAERKRDEEERAKWAERENTACDACKICEANC